MEFSTKSGKADKQRTACAIVCVFEKGNLSPSAEAIDRASGGALRKLIKSGDIDGQPNSALMLHDVAGVSAQRVLVVGAGPAEDFTAQKFRQMVTLAVQLADKSGAADAISYLDEIECPHCGQYWKARHTVEAASEALYCFDQMKSQKQKKTRPLKTLHINIPAGKRMAGAAEQGIEHGRAIASGVRVTRDLGNLPGNICTPTYLATQSKALARKSKKVTVQVLEEAQMKRLGMGALLSVSAGTRQPAKLICINYKGGKRGEKPVVLVGKGVTFDSGGISIKPGAAMDEMKFDMCGAASVVGTLTAAIEMKLPLNLVGVIPATENLPDGLATKPGDIVTSMSGQTIEVLNTDAEGRLILCDALTYAGKFKPDVVIDIATLTGACVVALGAHAAGLLGNDDELIKGILHAGTTSGDRAWQMPLWEEYQPQLDSNFADMANIGGPKAGTITAACFLSRFTKEYRWAHLDIAGVAWKQNAEKGATGRPVPLLMQYLIERCEK